MTARKDRRQKKAVLQRDRINKRRERFDKTFFIAGMLVLTLTLFMWPNGNSAATAAATDTAGHWAEATINEMIAQELTSGYPDGTFKPDNQITRAEFTALMVRTFALEAKSGKVFTDTVGHWAQEVITTAHAAGIINGYDEQTFAPDQLITREQMAVMVTNALREETNLLKLTNSLNYEDIDQTATWARDSVEKIVVLGLLKGYPDATFRSQANATRAEAVVLLSRSMNILPQFTPDKLRAEFNQAGTYGAKAAVLTLKGDVTVSADGVILQNLVIDGDLTITAAVGDGDVTCNNVTVNGTTTILGGGVDSIHLNGGSFQQIIVNNTPSKAVRLVVVAAVKPDVFIAEKAIGQKVILEGNFNRVEVQANEAVLSTQGKTEIEELKVTENRSNVVIDVPTETKIRRLTLQSPATVNNAKESINNVSGTSAPSSSIENKPSSEKKYRLSLEVNDESQGTVNGAGRYKKGAMATVTATPEPGYIFARWFLDGEVFGAEPIIEYEVRQNETLLAYFIPEGYEAVATAEDLANIETALEGNYIQIADIDLGVAPYNEGAGWDPIGVYTLDEDGDLADYASFTGRFDGNGYQIRNLTINSADIMVGGLFLINGGELESITLSDVSITGQGMYAGGLAGVNEGIMNQCVVNGSVTGHMYIGGLTGFNFKTGESGGEITACQVTGNVTGVIADRQDDRKRMIGSTLAPAEYIGGLVGRNQETITACHTEVEVIAGDAIVREGDEEYVDFSRSIGGITGSNAEEGVITDTHAAGFVRGGSDTAGLVGANTGRIENCSATADVVGTEESTGGLVGDNSGQIIDCFTTGDVVGIDYVGGLAGDTMGDEEISNCYTTGSVEGEEYVGGLIGLNYSPISDCHATGRVTGERNFVGGLVGENRYVITNSYADGVVEGSTAVGGLVGINRNDYETARVNYCYATGEVKGEEGVGGLVGINEGEIIGSYALNPRLIRIGTADTFGRICGDNQREYVLTINFADLHMEAPFEEAFNAVAYDGKDGSDSDPAAVAAINEAANAAGGLSESEIDAGVFEAAGIAWFYPEELTFVKVVLDEAAQEVDGEVNWLPSEIYDIIDSIRR